MFIFDASTLILTAKVELLDAFLASIKLEVAIPPQVRKECCGVKRTLDALMIEKALDKSRIRVVAVRNRRLVGRLQVDFSLGRGEAEAIALAHLEHAQILGIDDKNGINACKLLGIGFTTALGILVRSHEKGLIDTSAATAKLAILAREGRYKSSIIAEARKQLEEER